MPAKSEKQRRFMGMIYGAKKSGKTSELSGEAREASKSLSTQQAKDFAKKSSAGRAAELLAEGAKLNLSRLGQVAELGLTGVVGSGLGTLGGFGAARLLGPSTQSIGNLRKTEEAMAYQIMIDELKARMAARRQRLLG